jgi:hypothetical protein
VIHFGREGWEENQRENCRGKEIYEWVLKNKFSNKAKNEREGIPNKGPFQGQSFQGKGEEKHKEELVIKREMLLIIS